MPVTNIFGHTTPRVGSGPQDSDGPRNIQKAFDDYSASLHPTVVVDTVHEIAPLAGRLPPGSFPVFFWVRGERATYCVPERGAAAQWYAGGAYIWDSPLEELKLPNGTWTQTSPAAPRAQRRVSKPNKARSCSLRMGCTRSTHRSDSRRRRRRRPVS